MVAERPVKEGEKEIDLREIGVRLVCKRLVAQKGPGTGTTVSRKRAFGGLTCSPKREIWCD